MNTEELYHQFLWLSTIDFDKWFFLVKIDLEIENVNNSKIGREYSMPNSNIYILYIVSLTV